MQFRLIFIFLLIITQVAGQSTNLSDSLRKAYLAELKITGRKFTSVFYPNYAAIYSLPERTFIKKIDSVRNEFNAVLNRYSSKIDPLFLREQKIEIKYYFDKLLIEYPVNHDNYISSNRATHSSIPHRLQANLRDFNNVSLLTNADFTAYVKAFFSYQTEMELKKPAYLNTDNRQLNAIWTVIPRYITDKKCRDFWRTEYLYSHIDNNGIKNIEKVYADFRATCMDTAALSRIRSVYTEDSIGRAGHLITAYKRVGPFTLDMHLFLPDHVKQGDQRPVIIFFHGGSWSEGKPDWFFASCENYAQKGWVACAVEYRTSGRQGTLPFQAVMDARSSIRWLREHAKEFNIDTGRIIASGNSAGGHLVLCTSLADKWNEKTDNLALSATPNVMLINSGVYDLTDEKTAWIRKELKDKATVNQISPDHLIKNKIPPALIIHGTNDQNVPYGSAERFVTEMRKAGNVSIDFEPLKGAGHFIWFDPKYAEVISKLRTEFLKKLGYQL